MKIFGIGTDIVSIVRIKKTIKNKRFVSRVYNEKEIFKCKKLINSENCFAKRFAAKEAFAKALGTGIGKIVSFQDLTIRNNDNGKPYFIPSEKLRLYLVSQNIKQAHLSLSDEKLNAVAFVVLELGEENEEQSKDYGTTF